MDFIFYPSDEKWEGALGWVVTLMIDCIVPVNEDLLKRQDLVGLDEVICEIQEGWSSVEAYEDKGFGCAAIQDTVEGPTIICWCLTDWVETTPVRLGVTHKHLIKAGTGMEMLHCIGTQLACFI